MIDYGWFEKILKEEVLPNWLKSAVTESGLFWSSLDRKWRRIGENVGTLVSQSRLLYNFSKGYELFHSDEYRKAVESGGNFLLENFRDREEGGWFWSCDSDGNVVDLKKDGNGHGFVIFGLSNAYRVIKDDRFRDGAYYTWDILDGKFRDKYGGLARSMTVDFVDKDVQKAENQVMHTFEAMLALSEIDERGDIIDAAEGLANFVFSHLFRDGYLPALYTLEWTPLPEGSGGYVSVGHQFEWAYLLSWGVDLGMDKRYLSYAEDLLDFGLKAGYDSEYGGIFDPATYDGKAISKDKGWWPQCEAVRTLIHFAAHRNRKHLEELMGTIDFIKEHFIDKEYGGLYSAIDSNGAPSNMNKGDIWKLDYHLVGMCVEALRMRHGKTKTESKSINTGDWL